MRFSKALRGAGAAAFLVGGLALAACGEREAEVEAGSGEAEVSTELPENVVSDTQLEAAAAGAAAAASGRRGQRHGDHQHHPVGHAGPGASPGPMRAWQLRYAPRQGTAVARPLHEGLRTRPPPKLTATSSGGVGVRP